MFGRKKPTQSDGQPGGVTAAESERNSSYRGVNDIAPPVTGAARTTSYRNAMQTDGRGYETIN